MAQPTCRCFFSIRWSASCRGVKYSAAGIISRSSHSSKSSKSSKSDMSGSLTDHSSVAWTTGCDQFCYEIFKPLLSGTKERYADFKKNKTRVLKGLLFQVTPMMCSTSLIRRLTVFGMCSMHMQNYEKTKYFYRVSKIMNEIRLFRMCFRLGIQKRSTAT